MHKTTLKPKATLIFKNCCVCVHIIVHNCRTQHSTEQNSLDNLPSYPPDNHHSSDNVYWRGWGNVPATFIGWLGFNDAFNNLRYAVPLRL